MDSAISTKRFISFSGGVESTTMCILFGKGAKAIWCDTGAEHEKMYERMSNIEARLKELHSGDFELIRITPSVKVKGVFVDNLLDAVLGWRFMPSPINRYCTGKFKIEPIDNFLSQQGECELMIGLNADEENSRSGNWGLKANVKYTYPLQEKGLTRADCEDVLKIHGMHPNFPAYMLRGGVQCVSTSLKKSTRLCITWIERSLTKWLYLKNPIRIKGKKYTALCRVGKH